MSRTIQLFGFGVLAMSLLVPSSIAVVAPAVAENVVAEVKSLLPTKEVTLVFVGDIMFDRGVLGSVNRNFGGDFNRLYDHTSFLKEADIAVGNLEGPVSNQGHNVGSIYSFRMKPEGLQAAATAGFDVLSVANNHAGDWTVAAFADTVSRLKNLNIIYPGGGVNYQEAKAVQVKKIGGLTIGFLGFTDVGPNWLAASEAAPGILLASDPNYSNIISSATQEVDVLVVSIHFGEEYQPRSNSRQQYLARLAIDSGATIVAGHHPHVVQELERYKDGVIAYSLGNFIFDQNFSKETMEGGVLEVKIHDKTIASAELKTVVLNSQYQPQPRW